MKKELQIAYSNFGYRPWGKTIIGKAVMANPEDACKPVQPITTTEENPPSILIVKRGGCKFVTKAYHAQNVGVEMVIVLNNMAEDISHLVLVDEGSGRKDQKKIFIK